MLIHTLSPGKHSLDILYKKYKNKNIQQQQQQQKFPVLINIHTQSGQKSFKSLEMFWMVKLIPLFQ